MESNNRKTWEVNDVHSSNSVRLRKSIELVAANKIAGIRISNVYEKEEIQIIVQNISKQGVVWYPNFEFKQGRIGICATEYHSKIHGKEAYFILEAENSKVRNHIFPGNLDPVERMINIFSLAYETHLATEPQMNDSKYFTGLIRAMRHESTTHFDYAPHQLDGWWVSGTEVQFAVVTYLQTSEEGGELTIYEHQWEENDDVYNKDINEKGAQGFDDKFLKNSTAIKISPKEGDMIIFNSRNFHKVERVNSERIRLSINSFMSLKDEKMYFWN
jgi:hypothetical protein